MTACRCLIAKPFIGPIVPDPSSSASECLEVVSRRNLVRLCAPSSSSEQASYRLKVSELVDNGPAPRVEEEIVSLLTVTCAFKNFGGDKATGLSRLSGDMAADFPKNALHGRDGFRVEFAHLYSLN
ncbi:MAG TPA: hypothetical protein VKB08_10295 [Bradyrhizobium sp.]|nr:hypothetical protein [Bradyrhizobium sp.]